MLRETAADAVPEWIAGSEHHRRTAAAGEHPAHIERRRPGTAAVTDPGQRQMTYAAEYGLSRSERLSACLREPVKAIFPDADNGEPGINHDARPHPGRNERRQSSRGGRRATGA